MTVLLLPTPNDPEEQIPQPGRDRAHLSGTDRPVIDLRYCRQLHTRTAEKSFIGDVEFSSIDRTLDHFHTEVLSEQLDHRPTDNSFQNVIGHGWSQHGTVPDQEHVRRRTF